MTKPTDKEKPSTALAPVKTLAPLSAEEMELMQGDFGAGLENVDMRDMVIPYVKIIQQLSPELNPRKSEFIEGLQIGQFLNSATKQVFDSLHVIPVAYRRRNVEWKPNRGGFVKDWGDDERIVSACKKDATSNALITPDGNVLQVQGCFFCLEVSGPIPQRMVISLASTQFQHSKEWITKIKGELVPAQTPTGVALVNPPIWYRSYKCEAQPESNDRGDWMGWKIVSAEKTVDLPEGRMFYNMARDFMSAVKSGEVQAAVDEGDVQTRNSEDIPF